jgi:septum formation protein
MEDKRNNQTSVVASDDLAEHPGNCARIVELPRIVLASASPRRAEILRTVGWPFETLVLDIDETRAAGEDAATYVQRLARAKADAAALRYPASMIVAADTVVVIDEQILGKPQDDEDARDMLRQLSGRWHQVLTGVAFIAGASAEFSLAYEKTEVKFAVMGQDEIDWYVASGEPRDKAGAYAIQGLGARFIEGIRGDYSNVVGLPVRLLYELVTAV